MTATNQPFGMRPVDTIGGVYGKFSVQSAVIASGATDNFYTYQPVRYTTSGTIAPLSTGTEAFIGVFLGVQYTPANGRPVVLPNWAANTVLQTGTQAIVYFTDDPNIIYEIQAAGSIAQTAIGDQANPQNLTDNNGLGYSQCRLSTTLAGAGSTGRLRILDKGLQVDNDWGDSFTIVQVQISDHQFVASRAAI